MEKWSSKLGFLLAAIGSAVGIGNIWRFSSVVGQNGGGAYLIPYLFAVFVFALPLMILELSMGRHFRATVVSAFRDVRPRLNIIGWLLSSIVFLILSYYLVVTGWTLGFVLFSVTGEMETFTQFTGSYQPVLFFLLSTLATGAVVSLGVEKGIERISKVMIPFVVIILAGLALFGSTLPGFTTGMTFLLAPDFSVLANPLIWSAAFGQAFFSLSVGQGILITYGAYVAKEEDIPRSALIITLADLSVALLAGAVIFPIVFSFNLAPAIGAELAFSTLPRAFALLPAGQVLAVAFFVVLFFAALTSAISMLEVGVAAIRESTQWSRPRVTALLTAGILLAGMPAALSYSAASLSIGNVRVLDYMDETVGTLGLPIAALLTAVIFSWYLQRSVIDSQIGTSGLRRFVFPLCKFIIPLVLVTTTALRLISSVDFAGWRFIPGTEFIGSLAQGTGILLILGILIVLIVIFCRLRECRLPARLRGW